MRSRRTTVWILGAAATAIVALPIELAGAHDFIARSQVTIGYVGFFQGKVKSGRASCERNRTVTVYRVATGPDPSYGSDRTNDNGRWRVDTTADTAGLYYAQASFRRTRSGGHDHVCLAGRSDEIDIG